MIKIAYVFIIVLCTLKCIYQSFRSNFIGKRRIRSDAERPLLYSKLYQNAY